MKGGRRRGRPTTTMMMMTDGFYAQMWPVSRKRYVQSTTMQKKRRVNLSVLSGKYTLSQAKQRNLASFEYAISIEPWSLLRMLECFGQTDKRCSVRKYYRWPYETPSRCMQLAQTTILKFSDAFLVNLCTLLTTNLTVQRKYLTSTSS